MGDELTVEQAAEQAEKIMEQYDLDHSGLLDRAEIMLVVEQLQREAKEAEQMQISPMILGGWVPLDQKQTDKILETRANVAKMLDRADALAEYTLLAPAANPTLKPFKDVCTKLAFLTQALVAAQS